MPSNTLRGALLGAAALLVLTSANALAAAGPPRGYTVVSSGQVLAPNGAQTRGFVSCPPNTVPLGGGAFVASSSVAVNLNSSFPTAVGWVADVNNETSVPTAFAVVAVCARKPTGYTVVPQTVANPARTRAVTTLTCPGRTKILGGGAFSSGGLSVNLGTTSLASNGWRVEESNATFGDASLTGFAICGRLKGYRVVIGTTVPNPPGTQTFAFATCPAPTVPIGGGVQNLQALLSVNVNTTFPSGNGWNVDVNNASPAGPNTATVAVICAGT
jgi:hypothetical protein